jgi:hypothetical protein
MASEDYSNLSGLALQYGPFFFALLFVLGVTRWAYGAFKENNAANTSPKAFNTMRLVFLCSFFFGLVLVVVSVSWWLRSRPAIYVFRGEIVDLRDYEKLASATDKLYLRREPKDPIDDIALRNEHFLVVQDSPLRKGDSFDVEFSKNSSARNTFHIDYDPADSYPKFGVDWDDNLHTNIMRRCKQPTTPTPARAGLFTWIVYAAQAEMQVYQGKPSRSQAAQQASSPIAVLQDSSSDVGSKIVALDQLDGMPASALTDPSSPGHEPVLATLLDLTRYSDKEVSYKASIVIQRVDIDEYVAGKLESSNKHDQTDGEQVLRKLNADESARILLKLAPAKSAAWRARASQSPTLQVVPTASGQGDRYYVRATWDGKNSATVDCLTTLFHEVLVSGSNRTLGEERALMKRSQRLVYAYDKDWSINIAQKIQACGGKAAFVQAGGK